MVLKNTQVCITLLYASLNLFESFFLGSIGAVDGTHIKVTVEATQHDSYVDRYMDHSINLMAVCNADRVFIYIFAGFPGSAHDSRVKIFLLMLGI